MREFERRFLVEQVIEGNRLEEGLYICTQRLPEEMGDTPVNPRAAFFGVKA
jgi:hypothetical protein